MARNRPTPREKREMQDRFLEAYEAIQTISGAAQQAGINRGTHYGWMAEDPDYAVRFARSDEVAVQRLEQEARRRAIIGTKEPVFYKGEVCGEVTKKSDTLLIFLLKARRPEVYRERFDIKNTVSGKVQHEHSAAVYSSETLRIMRKEQLAAEKESKELAE